MSDRVWRVWLALGSLWAVVAGLWLIAASLAPDALGFDDTVHLVFWPNGATAGGPVATARLATAVSGALTAGWGVMAWLLGPVLAGRTGVDAARTTGRALAIGLIAWFVMDSTASVLVGAAVNVAGNVTLIVALLPPALASARSAERPGARAGGTP